jgi:hypothetical protein
MAAASRSHTAGLLKPIAYPNEGHAELMNRQTALLGEIVPTHKAPAGRIDPDADPPNAGRDLARITGKLRTGANKFHPMEALAMSNILLLPSNTCLRSKIEVRKDL